MPDRYEPSHGMTRRAALTRLGGVAFAVGSVGSPIGIARSVSGFTEHKDAEDFERLLRLSNVPSMSMAFVDGDRISTRSAGVRRIGESERTTPDTVYGAASLTKAVFSYLLLGLVGDGLLDLDRPIREYLPLPNPDDGRARTITARHLLSHSGGWRNWRANETQALTADFEPGTRWSYSGEGFFFLQRVLEKLTGRGFAALARERVFNPLGMKRSSMIALAELDPYRAVPHNGRGEPIPLVASATLLELRRMMAARGEGAESVRIADSEQAIKAADPTQPVLPNFLTPNAAASLLTTASDYGLFLRHLVTALRNGGAAARIVELMMSPQIRCNEAVQWGLGVGLEEMSGRQYAWQWGDNTGFKNFFFADPRNEKAMVVFTNGERGARVYERVVRAESGGDQPGFLWI